MDMKMWLKQPDKTEKPLDRFVENGGYCGIFRTIGCIGDSLSSGEFETLDPNGTHRYYDMYDYSWGQFLARMTGSKVYNFSRGGMTAREYMENFADANDFWNPNMACQAYIIALGVNELVCQRETVGCTNDINMADWRQNAHTFVGYCAMIIQRLKEIQPEAKFFLMTMPREASDNEELVAIRDRHAEVLSEMTRLFSNTYLIDLRTYAPVYDADFRNRFYLHTHMTPCGYAFTAQMVASYIDFIIRTDMDRFKEVGFIGTPYKNNI